MSVELEKLEYLYYIDLLVDAEDLVSIKQEKHQEADEKLQASKAELNDIEDQLKAEKDKMSKVTSNIHDESVKLEGLNTQKMNKILIVVGFAALAALLFRNLTVTIIITIIFFFVYAF